MPRYIVIKTNINEAWRFEDIKSSKQHILNLRCGSKKTSAVFHNKTEATLKIKD